MDASVYYGMVSLSKLFATMMIRYAIGGILYQTFVSWYDLGCSEIIVLRDYVFWRYVKISLRTPISTDRSCGVTRVGACEGGNFLV